MDGASVRLDPAVETSGLWHTFHTHFIAVLYEHLSEALAPRYLTYIEERVVITSDELPPTAYRPDVRVTRPTEAHESRAGFGVSVPPAAFVPGLIAVPYEDKQRFIEVRARGGDLVTVVELLSPSNKHDGRGRRGYLRKRERMLMSAVHLVEIDLLRGGARMPILTPWPPGDRFVLVARGDTPGQVEIYPINADAPLPAIRFPLGAPDPDYVLGLQAVLAEVWQKGRFDLKLEYARAP